MLEAEKSCGKKLSKYPVSDKLTQSIKLIKYWKIRSHHEEDELDQEYLKSLNPKHYKTPRTHQQIRKKIKEAIEQLRQDILFSNELREKFLQEIVEQAIKKNNIKEASEIRSIKNCERIEKDI